MAVDVEQFRTLLDEERSRVVDAIEYLHRENSGPNDDEVQDNPSENHLADAATETLDREIDSTLEENSEHVLAAIDAALERIEEGTFGKCVNCGKEIAEERLDGAAVGDAVHRLQAPRGARLTEPVARRADVRVGSSTDALTPSRALTARWPRVRSNGSACPRSQWPRWPATS